jgi:hypothetical protein
VNSSLGKPTLTTAEVMEIYRNLKPTSPFAQIDTEAIIAKHRAKDYARLYFFIIIAALCIAGVRYYFNRYYFSL